MKKRIGNDIAFTWHIYRNDGDTQVPESFAGKDVEVKLISPLQRPVTIEDVTIATGVVTFTFRGKHQVTLGNYVAVLQENRGENGMATIDVVNAVTLVPHSYMEEDGDEGDVIEAEAVELTSTISAGGGGIEQQQADWAQTDDTAVDFIKNKPDLDVYCRKDATNVHTGGYDQYIYNFGEESVGNVAIDAQGLWARLLYPNGELVSETRIGPGNIRIAKNGVTLNLSPAYFQALAETMQNKVDKVTGKGLSTNDYTTADKEKLNDLPTATELTQELAGKANTADLASVATSGSYNDLSDTPTIPDITDKADKVSNATNGNFAALDSNGNLIDSGHKHSDYLTQHQDLSNYVQKSQTAGLLKNDGTVDTTQYLSQHQDISGKENITPIEAVASGTTAINAAVNTYYEVAGEVGTLAITLPTPTDLTKVSMVVVHLTAGTNPNVVIGSTATIDYSSAYDISASKEYEINCLYNGDKWIVADMEVV